MPVGMQHVDRHGEEDRYDDDLPDLPIPRPGEWSPMRAAAPGPEPISVPRLAGGASFTASDEAQDTDAAPDGRIAPAATERLPWDLAAQLTAGMLANPARANSSVKEAMGLFDQFLQEMYAYARIASTFDLLGSDAQRRRAHEEYFHGAREHEQPEPARRPAPATPQPKPEPSQPRPMGDYKPLPIARSPYVPGSMAGAPPPTVDDPTQRNDAA